MTARTAADLNPGDRIGFGINSTGTATVVEVREPMHGAAAAVGLLVLVLDVDVTTGRQRTLVRVTQTADPRRLYRLLSPEGDR